jgi:cellulose synthase (UDP-forming)
MNSPRQLAPRSSRRAVLTRAGGLLLLALALVSVASLEMSWQQQAAFGGVLVAAALLISRFRGESSVYILILLSGTATARYAWWRYDSLRHYFVSPWIHVDPFNAVSMLLLIGAETYSFAILYLGFVQTISPLRRPPAPLPEDHALWPTVDVMVPTYNEPLEVVRYTVLAAQEIDWPQDKITVWLLDDGDREDFRAFAEAAGVHYVARPQHDHAKAGNINYALARTKGELVAIFDSDHIPTRSFLQMTAGWFLRDRNLGMLQTPHHFYSPDPFERNLDHFRQVPNEGELFYGIIQDTNDLWNATFFCGSCAVLRREALDSVGGIAHETVTEDAHTSFRMHKIGWNTAYINLIQSAGLATESIGDHIKQRVRWARGMAQILRIDNPLFAKGLRPPQRICYFNAMAHFFYALPRLIFLTSPILYLVFGKLNIPGYWLTILVFALPHLAMATITNSRIQGEKRHSFWNEIYETVLSPYILLPTLLALVSPKLGKFNVTAKGQNKEDDSFDSKMARPFVFLLGLNVLALAMAIPRCLYWDPGHLGTILMNIFWTLFNIVVLGVTLSVCWETRQRRTAVRITTPIPVRLESAGKSCLAVTADISVGGASVLVKGEWAQGQRVSISFPEEDGQASLVAHVVKLTAKGVSLAFDASTIEDQRLITRVLYSRADRWLSWTDSRVSDNPLRSLFEVGASSVGGFAKMFRLGAPGTNGANASSSKDRALNSAKAAHARNIGVLLILLWPLALALATAQASAPAPAPGPAEDAPSPHPVRSVASEDAPVNYQFALGSLGAKNGILLDRDDRGQTIAISLPSTSLIEGGELHVKYSLPEASKGGMGTFDVLLNDSALASITPTDDDISRRGGDVVIPLPADQLVHDNRLTLRLASSPDAACGAEAQGSAPIRIDPETSIAFSARRLPIASDLALLPEPFLQRAASLPQALPFVFADAPDAVTLQAAGVLASWAGTQVYTSAPSFPAQVGSLPSGNAVVLLLGNRQMDGLEAPLSSAPPSSAPPSSAPPSSAPTVAVLPNPLDPLAKLLVLRAETPERLLALAQAFSLGQLNFAGQTAPLETFALPARRSPNDAPRWIHADRVPLSQLAGAETLAVDGSNPLSFYLHFAPDFNFGNRKDMYLHLDYSAAAEALDRRSNIQVRLNGNPAGSVPLMIGKNRTADIPLGDLPAAVFANTMQVQFFGVPTAARACDGSNRFAAAVGKGSYLDMGGAAHLVSLPNLLLFANAGFPFTRFADLGETAVVLPAAPTAAELTLYLDLMGYFGAQTGYPALRVQVAHPGEEPTLAGKDLLVLGTFRAVAVLGEEGVALPFGFDGAAWSLTRAAMIVDRLNRWLRPGASADGFPLDDSSSPDGIVEAIRSPYAGDRSIVVVAAKDDAALPAMTAELLNQLPQDSIHDNVSLWQGGSFASYRLFAPGYSLGDASPITKARLLLPQFPVLVALALLAVCALFSLVIRSYVRGRVRERLAFSPGALALGEADPGVL